MRKILDYVIIRSSDDEELAGLVANKMRDNFEPIGGVTAVRTRDSRDNEITMFYQAMVEYSE
jgi:hypothetical protein